MILLIDNYDSFVFNLARYLEQLGQETLVVRNDAVSARQVRELAPAAVVLSPGPGVPGQAGGLLDVVRGFHEQVPMLGVCLGHQAIAEALGARVVRAREPVHGRASAVRHDGHGLFAGAPNPLTACRYHSLVVEEASLPSELEVSARTIDGVVMGIRHRRLPLFGIQFHPESILTQWGHALLANFLRLSRLSVTSCPQIEAPVQRRARSQHFRPATPVPY